jgi:phosphomannomutase
MPLRQALRYQPVELEFGTSGLRGLVKDITDLEAYVAVGAFLQFLLEAKGVEAGCQVFVGGDLRPSTGDIMVPVCRAIRDAGFAPALLGRIPSPALLWYAMKRGCPSVMITGSHIPFDRNGIKLNRRDGEVRKSDEAPIRAAQKRLREAEYRRPAEQSMFGERGALRGAHRIALPPEIQDAGSEYLLRYAKAFPQSALEGKNILVYQHSAVGRDLLVQALANLGATVVPAGRSDTFVPVDTEAVNEEMVRRIQDLVDVGGGARLDAVVSTDGDSDRPLVLGVEQGKVQFYPGDVLGIVTADFVGARDIAVPISVNDAVDAWFNPRGIKPVKTRIGSPYVIEAMKHVGWEANGGFLTTAPVTIPGGGTLQPLPTRDAMLPILAALCASLARGTTLADLFSRLPSRFGKSGLLREFPRDQAVEIIKRLSPLDTSVIEAHLDSSDSPQWVVVRQDGSRTRLREADSLARCLRDICAEIGRYFTPRDGFSAVAWINWLDGVRIGFGNGDIAHIRPSGNAPELRMYANASTVTRAEQIVGLGIADRGILRRLAAAVEEHRAIETFCAAPQALILECPVQHYAWGGYAFIPALLGMDNSERLPYAELWIGAHPIAPSIAVVEGKKASLDRMIQSTPEILGGPDAGRFGGQLPFLMKVLDARVMLSIQAHPTKDQAEAGFARENAAGIPRDAPDRMYRDDNHKPEAHVALTEFWMLHGFRPLEEIAQMLEAVPELGAVMPDFAARLQAAGKEAAMRTRLLRELYTSLMTMPQSRVDALLAPLLHRISAREAFQGLDKDTPDFWAFRASCDLPLPGGHVDRGIFSIYLLNLLHLHPGEGTYQPAGTLHAYLEGTTVELMANSDNVLRGGLTPKSVDTVELLKVVSFEDGMPSVLHGQNDGRGVRSYDTPAEEFVLDRIDLRADSGLRSSIGHGVECLLVMQGNAGVISATHKLDLARGAAAIVPAGIPYDLRSQAMETLAFRARIPEARTRLS